MFHSYSHVTRSPASSNTVTVLLAQVAPMKPWPESYIEPFNQRQTEYRSVNL